MGMQQVILDGNNKKQLVPVDINGTTLWALALPGPFPTDPVAIAQISAQVPVGGLVSSEEDS